ncbi:Tachykinin-like peptides receptor 99D [Lamellibrachia satsuma]|nr:Tachykinin-like peptides receptor 99D [Lamellibrachia satsuma]
MDVTVATLLRLSDNLSLSEPDSATALTDIANGATGNGTSGGHPRNPFIQPWYIQLLYIVAFVTMVIVATGGNIIVIWIVLAHKRMRTVTNYFLVNLAVADTLISVFNTVFNSVYMLYSDWPFGRSYCKFNMFIAPCTISASVFTFMAIAVDRYVAILHPLRLRMRAGTVFTVIIVIWTASFLVAFPNLLYARTHTWYDNGAPLRTICYIMWPDGMYAQTDFIYSIFIMFVNYLIPLGALAGTYSRVGITLWGSRAIGEYTTTQQETINSKRRVVKMMIVVVVIFAVCWFPQHAFFLIANQQPELAKGNCVQHVYLVIYWLAMSNSMYNPIIYCWMNKKFRVGFKYVFRWLPCVTWTHDDFLLLDCKSAIIRMSMTETTRYPSERNGSYTGTPVTSSPLSSNYKNMIYSSVPRSTEHQL